MSIYTNAVYGMRKYAGGTKPAVYPNPLLGGVEQVRTQLRAYEAKIKQLQEDLAAGRVSEQKAKKEISSLLSQVNTATTELSRERQHHKDTRDALDTANKDNQQLIQDAAGLAGENERLEKRRRTFRGLGEDALALVKERVGQGWDTAKKSVSDIYAGGLPALQSRYKANKDLYDNLGFIGGGAVGGGALGALLAGRGNRLIGGTLGAIGGGSAGYLAKVLAKKYGYLS